MAGLFSQEEQKEPHAVPITFPGAGPKPLLAFEVVFKKAVEERPSFSIHEVTPFNSGAAKWLKR